VRKIWIFALVGVFALAAAAVALAQTGTKQTISASVKTGSGKPKTNKHGTIHINLSASDPTNSQHFNQPDPARQLDVTLPKGMKLDTKAASTCSASDLDFQNKGSAACPSGTKIATGSAVVNTGLAPPVTKINATVEGFNGGKTLILYIVPQGAQPIVIRAKITGSASRGMHLVTNVQPNCIPPGKPSDNPPCQGKEAPIETFVLNTLSKHKGSGSKRHDLITTPSSCPSKGWKFGVKVTFAHIPPQNVSTQVSCRK
jgi:hypothetical protein